MADRLVVLDPIVDIDHPPALNLFDLGLGRLERYETVEREKLLNGAIALYEYVFGALLGAELTNRQAVIFRYLARLIMTVPKANIYTLMDFMQNPDEVRVHLDKLDRSARYFFETQFFSSEFDKTRQQILTRLWGVLSNSVLERMLSNERNKVDFFDAMNRGSVVLINTAKGPSQAGRMRDFRPVFYRADFPGCTGAGLYPREQAAADICLYRRGAGLF
jgi:hypothetical protein